MLLTAAPTRWLSRSYEVRDSSSLLLGEVRLSTCRAGGTIRVGGFQYGVSRQEVFFGPISLGGPNGKVARAVKLNAFSRAFAIEHEGHVFVFRSPSMWFREMRLFEDDREIGTAVPEGVFSCRAQFDLPESLPLEVRLFIVWLALYVWSRWQDSSVSFSGVLQTASRHG
jgi:hypothetical protein